MVSSNMGRVVLIEGPVWCGEYLYVDKGQDACIRVIEETNGSLVGIAAGGQKIEIRKDKYKWRELPCPN